MRTNKKIFIAVLALFGIVFLGYSFSYLTASDGSSGSNTLTLSNFDVKLLTDIENVTIDDGKTYPMTDSEGLNNESVTFAIHNDGTIPANYKVSLVDKDVVSTLNNSDVRFRLKRKVGNSDQEILEPDTLPDTGEIDVGTIAVNETITYELVLWVSYESTANAATFSKAVLVEAVQKTDSLDNSGANYPEILENMIPVYYDNESSTWKKADIKNSVREYQWFDYDNRMWANAVTVKSSGTKTREYYLDAPMGEVVDMDDITAMWVWIPRYKYIIFNGNDEVTSAKKIDVIFEI